MARRERDAPVGPPGGESMTTAIEIDSNAAHVMEQMPYGLYIVGTHDRAGEGNGMMADWVMQVAFIPRMVAVSFENDAHSLANVRETGSFTVNLLPRDDNGRALSARFAQPWDGGKVAGRSGGEQTHIHHKLEGIGYSLSEYGSPILDGAISWVECAAEQFLLLGDHTLVAGRVVDGGVRRDGDTLTSDYAGYSYCG